MTPILVTPRKNDASALTVELMIGSSEKKDKKIVKLELEQWKVNLSKIGTSFCLTVLIEKIKQSFVQFHVDDFETHSFEKNLF